MQATLGAESFELYETSGEETLRDVVKNAVLPPLLVISLAIVGRFYDRQAAPEQLLAQASGILGQTGSEAIGQILENASDPILSSIAAIIGAHSKFCNFIRWHCTFICAYL